MPLNGAYWLSVLNPEPSNLLCFLEEQVVLHGNGLHGYTIRGDVRLVIAAAAFHLMI